MVKILKSICSVSLIISLLFLELGCSMVAGTRQPFSVTASEPDAKIYINGEFIGTGNVQTTVPRARSTSVMVKKEGYYPTTRDIGTKMSSLGILDIIGGCIWLVPFIGLAFPGSHELDQSNVSLVLDKESK